MDTFIAKLPEGWSAYISTFTIQQFIELYGEDVALMKLDAYVKANLALKHNLEAQKKIQLSSTIYYNKQNIQPTPKKALKKVQKLTIPAW